MISPHAILLVRCPDRPGLVAAISGFLFAHGANILDFDQHTAADEGVYFTRLEFQTDALDVPLAALAERFEAEVARPFGMRWRLARTTDRRRIAVLASRADHALLEILWAARRGDLRGDVVAVISNHDALAPAVEGFGVPFHHVPNAADRRAEAEREMSRIFADAGADLVVLARYMQIVSPDLVSAWPERMINIHHSFLPAFAGADPYRQAFDRGVKIVGATAHYVTAELDQGPIIDQDVARVSHRHDVEDLKRLGRDLERRVLARAVRWHCEDRILVFGNKTIVFE
ncbi:MAG TPA: formyltetrahydrofolate deformylase [Anaeromyxobacteraceae bacterium]|nr:formyltetrahydrofolate deformylase [Anaeromyxobacteraceae bacterium]